MYGDVRGLEGAAAEHRRAGLRDRARRLERLLAVLNRARPGDQPEGVVADAAPAHLDHGRVGRELPRDELVRLQDRQDLLHAGVALERQRRERLALADRADHGRLAAGRHVRVGAGLGEPLDDVVDLLGRRVRAHDDQELWRSGDSHGTQDTSGLRGCSGHARVPGTTTGSRPRTSRTSPGADRATALEPRR